MKTTLVVFRRKEDAQSAARELAMREPGWTYYPANRRLVKGDEQRLYRAFENLEDVQYRLAGTVYNQVWWGTPQDQFTSEEIGYILSRVRPCAS